MGLMDEVDANILLSLNNGQTHIIDLADNEKDQSRLEITHNKVVYVDRDGVGRLVRTELVQALTHYLMAQDALLRSGENTTPPKPSATDAMLEYMYAMTMAAMKENAAAKDDALNPPKGRVREYATEYAKTSAVLTALCETTVRLEDIAAGREFSFGTTAAIQSLKTRLAIRNDRSTE